MISEIKEMFSCEVPTAPFIGELYMYPIFGWLEDCSNILPNECRVFAPLINEMLSHIVTPISYLTIDRKILKPGQTHRRGGIHIDGVYSKLGWDPSPGWNIDSSSIGMMIASNEIGCKAWEGEYVGTPGKGGDCSHMIEELNNMNSFLLDSNKVFLINSNGIHESICQEKETDRTVVRLSFPAQARLIA